MALTQQLEFGAACAPWTERRLLGYDLETTGADPLTAQPVSYALVDFDAGHRTASACSLVQPTVEISADAAAVHGISNEAVAERGVPLRTGLDTVLSRLVEASEAGVPVVGMNIRFDLIIVDTLARELTGNGLRDHGWNGPVLDIAVIDRHCDRWRKGKRRLSDLCTLYGVDAGEAHEAEADASASVHVLFAIARRYPQIAACDPAELTELQTQWRAEWFESFSRHRQQRRLPPLDESERHWPLAMPAPNH